MKSTRKIETPTLLKKEKDYIEKKILFTLIEK